MLPTLPDEIADCIGGIEQGWQDEAPEAVLGAEKMLLYNLDTPWASRDPTLMPQAVTD